MPQTCATCKHPQAREINRKIRAEAPYQDISRWLDELAEQDPPIGWAITRQALSRHHRDHLGKLGDRSPGRKPISGNFLQAVVEIVHDKLANNELQPTIGDGIKAQGELNRQADRSQDRDLFSKWALILGASAYPMARVLPPDLEAIEGTFRPLLTSGEQESSE